MGMAASQARLLTITARLSDNELRSQTINNAKMRLAAQSSQASENYINALNNATLKFTNYDETGASQVQPLTYNALTAYSSYNTQYGLTNTSGQILVSEAEADIFKRANGDLNAYLEAHGLKYTTTYFDNMGGLNNKDYPAPFDNISKDELQKWYEEYGSYENSVEVETYQKAYSEYLSSKNKLTHSLDSTLNAYFGESKDSAGNIIDGGYFNETNIASIGIDKLEALKNAYKGTGKYGYNNTTTQQFIPGLKEGGNARNDINKLLDSYKQNGNKLKVETTTSLNQNADGNSSFVLDNFEIFTKPNGEVIKVQYTEPAASDDDANPVKDNVTYNSTPITWSNQDGYYCWEPPITTTTTDAEGNTVNHYPKLDQFLNTFKITGSTTTDIGGIATPNETITAKTTKKDGQTIITINSVYSGDAIKGILLDLNKKLLTILKQNTDYVKYGEYLLNGGQATSDISETVGDCNTAKNKLLNVIFKDLTTKYRFPKTETIDDKDVLTPQKEATAMTIQEALDNGTININRLMDEEYILALAKNTLDKDGKTLTEDTTFLSDNFQTVIKTYILERNVIAENGTPKYAWIDENDTGNTGNADSKAQWYTNLFHRMQRGYKTLENGLAASSKWLEYALENGTVRMEQVDKSYNWKSLQYKTCTRITEETDDAAVAQAEAEYNRAMNDIKAKDNMYDIQLKNIDTEHSSLQTEYDSIKGVIDKNISRTFKFNQSA